MNHQIAVNTQTRTDLAKSEWVKLGLIAAAAGIVAVLVVQALATTIWPEITLFKPLDSYVRSAIFTLVPALGATALLAWLANHTKQPVQNFIKISAIVLAVSIIPDYILPVEYKTFLASSVAAFLHIVAAGIIVLVLVVGYQRQ
jgi:hypothetical protein